MKEKIIEDGRNILILPENFEAFTASRGERIESVKAFSNVIFTGLPIYVGLSPISGKEVYEVTAGDGGGDGDGGWFFLTHPEMGGDIRLYSSIQENYRNFTRFKSGICFYYIGYDGYNVVTIFDDKKISRLSEAEAIGNGLISLLHKGVTWK